MYVLSVMPGLVFTELVDIRMREEGLDGSVAVPMAVPARHAGVLRGVRESDGIHGPDLLG